MLFYFHSMFSRTIKIPAEIIFIEEDGYHLLIHPVINDREASLLVDTGASRTVFDKERFLKLAGEQEFEKNDKLSTGLGTNSMETQMTHVENFKLGSLLIRNFEVIILDLHHVNASYQKLGLREIDGVLGNDILMNYKAIIDFGKKELRLMPTR
jgi:predicted aspartyl protease